MSQEHWDAIAERCAEEASTEGLRVRVGASKRYPIEISFDAWKSCQCMAAESAYELLQELQMVLLKHKAKVKP